MQIVETIREQEAGMPAVEVCRLYGPGPFALFKLKAKYGGLKVLEAIRLKAQKEEHARRGTKPSPCIARTIS